MFIDKKIKKNLSAQIIKYKSALKLNEESIKEFFRLNGFDTININFLNNSTNGTICKENTKYFFKILNKKDFIMEINGYINIYRNYPVNEIKNIFHLKNYHIIIIEFEETINENAGLINDFLIKCDIENNVDEKILSRIIDIYEKNMHHKIIKKHYPMEKFFGERVDTRLNKWYKDVKHFDYDIKVNDYPKVNTRDVLNKVSKYFKTDKKATCILSQGDPNTLNIGIKPIWFDFQTAGFNPAICEFSVMALAILFSSAYIDAKYHKNSYYNHEKIFGVVQNYKQDISYTIDDDNKLINIKLKLHSTTSRKIFMLKYLDALEKNNIKFGKELFFYLAMRTICVHDVRNMEESDALFCLGMMHLLYNEIYLKPDFNIKGLINQL